MAYTLLDADDVARELALLDGWQSSADGASINRTFVFKTFTQAFAFMTECAFAAERLNHHPDWFNSYATVQVSLTTHTKKRLTDRDFQLAHAMEQVFRRHV